MRVNARIDEATQQQLQYLTQTTGESLSHVLRESVAHYYVQVRGQRKPSRFLALAGQGDSGLTDVASNVKKYLTESLERKHGLAPRPDPATPEPAGVPMAPRRKRPPAA